MTETMTMICNRASDLVKTEDDCRQLITQYSNRRSIWGAL